MLKFLRGSPDGIQAWNRRRDYGELVPIVDGVDVIGRDVDWPGGPLR